MTDDARVQERADFLKAAGWGDAAATALTGDASTRSYERLSLGERKALLMNAPLGEEATPCPPNASDDERRALGYNALARLAGPNLNAFLAISDTLCKAGLSAPEIFAANPKTGFALIEDLGDDLYARAIPNGADEKELYKSAIDALISLRRANPPRPQSEQYSMLDYDRLAMEAEIALLIDWYWEHKTGAAPSNDLQAEYKEAWTPVLALVSEPHLMVLRDYHAENLLWLPDRDGARRTGLIDFQDGLYGHAAYDLVSLLEDARRDVDPALGDATLNYYCGQASDLPGFDEARLRSDYAILGAQRNAKILGIFARLVHRDGKPRYLDFMPRVENHFRNDLRHPALAPLKTFFAKHMPELAP